LTNSQKKWAKGRLTELAAHYIGDEMVWNVISHNAMNSDFLSVVSSDCDSRYEEETPVRPDEISELKIGMVVRTELRKVLEDGKVSMDEIEKLQTKQYSKDTFHIQYPLLMKASLTNGISPARYYSSPITILGEKYFLCSEWYEVPQNNDRPHLMKWLALKL
jgi:hypothetical protein